MTGLLRLRLISLVLTGAAAIVGCGSDDEGAGTTPTGGAGGVGATGGAGGQPSGGAPSGGATGGGAPATGGTSGAGGAGTAACDLTPCEGVVIGGVTAPTCCMTDTQCGVGIAPNCVDRSTVEQFQGDAGALFAAEDVYTDPACENQKLNTGAVNITVGGCCDMSGVCGVSSDGFPGFPVACLTADEIVEVLDSLGVSLPVDAGAGADAAAPVPCTYAGPRPDASAGSDGGS